MKNTKKIIALLLVLILSVSILASCGGSSLSGKYYAVSMDDEDETYDEGDFYIEFLKNGKCKMVSGNYENTDVTYTIDGKNIKLISTEYPDEPISGTIDGKKITFKDGDNYTIVFEKK